MQYRIIARINATYNKRTNSLIGKNGANLRGLVVLRIGNTRQQIKFKSDNNDKKVNGNKTYSNTIYTKGVIL